MTQTTAGFSTWVQGARPKTLPAAVVPVLVGTAAAAQADLGWARGVVAWRFVAALIVSLALQVAVNFANDYSDGIRGTDDERRVGPVRLVGQGLAKPKQVKAAAFAAFGVAGVFGLALAIAVGWELIVVGAASMLAGWFYTGGSRPYGYAGFGEVFVFVFFGVVATAGSAYVQLEELTPLALVVSLPVGFLATALLVTNNLRVIPRDRVSEKLTLAVRLGDQRTRVLYTVLVFGAFVFVPWIAGVWRVWAVLALIAVPLARKPVTTVLEGATGPSLISVLERTGRVQLVFGLLLAGGLFFSVVG